MPLRQSTPRTWPLPALAAAAGLLLLALSLGAREARAPEAAGQLLAQKPYHVAAIEPQQTPVVRSSKRSQAALRGKAPAKTAATLIAFTPALAVERPRAGRHVQAAQTTGFTLLRRQRVRAPPSSAALT